MSSGAKNPVSKLISKSRLASTDGHTEGPWLWNINMSSKSVELLGRSIVMDFVRWGMDRACPRFMRKLSGDVCILERPHEIPGMIQPIPEREHHFKWRADLNHPDANLIALAAELKEENEMLRQAIASAAEDIEYRGDPEPPSVWHLVDLAHKIKELCPGEGGVDE